VRGALPSPVFSLAWIHSVEKTRWEERYRVEGQRLVLWQARIQGMGAGMETGPGAQLVNGWWVWQPEIAPLAELRLTLSPYTRDYILCSGGTCHRLAAWVRKAETTDVVTVRPCER
jgi:hypothetical protein